MIDILKIIAPFVSQKVLVDFEQAAVNAYKGIPTSSHKRLLFTFVPEYFTQSQ